MLVAIKDQSFPQVGTVLEIPPNATMDTSIGVQWMKQEKAAHKPKWSRFFQPSTSVGTITFHHILLYDFQLTNKGALKKKVSGIPTKRAHLECSCTCHKSIHYHCYENSESNH